MRSADRLTSHLGSFSLDLFVVHVHVVHSHKRVFGIAVSLQQLTSLAWMAVSRCSARWIRRVIPQVARVASDCHFSRSPSAIQSVPYTRNAANAAVRDVSTPACVSQARISLKARVQNAMPDRMFRTASIVVYSSRSIREDAMLRANNCQPTLCPASASLTLRRRRSRSSKA